MRWRCKTGLPARVESAMTPMIDIVFLLLVFFVLTFKIVVAEGDFNVKMPRHGGNGPEVAPPLHVALSAAADGRLAGIKLGERELKDMRALRGEIIAVVAQVDARQREELAVELSCPADLDYRHVIEAITAVSGYHDPQGQRVELIRRVRFAPPETAGQR